jgi:hypothetical protein
MLGESEPTDGASVQAVPGVVVTRADDGSALGLRGRPSAFWVVWPSETAGAAQDVRV